jgi:hypothetical protein
MEAALICFGIICALGVFALIWLLYIFLKIREDVYNMPRKPMTICDKHGAYPTECNLSITVPLTEPNGEEREIQQEICPFCYRERLDEFKNSMKALSK